MLEAAPPADMGMPADLAPIPDRPEALVINKRPWERILAAGALVAVSLGLSASAATAKPNRQDSAKAGIGTNIEAVSGDTLASSTQQTTDPREYIPLPRSNVDRPDDKSGPQWHVDYIVPNGCTDAKSDINGSLQNQIKAIDEKWKAVTPGKQPRWDTLNGQLDITYIQPPEKVYESRYPYGYTTCKGLSEMPSMPDVVAEIDKYITRPSNGKMHLVFLESDSTMPYCAFGFWPPYHSETQPTYISENPYHTVVKPIPGNSKCTLDPNIAPDPSRSLTQDSYVFAGMLYQSAVPNWSGKTSTDILDSGPWAYYTWGGFKYSYNDQDIHNHQGVISASPLVESPPSAPPVVITSKNHLHIGRRGAMKAGNLTVRGAGINCGVIGKDCDQTFTVKTINGAVQETPIEKLTATTKAGYRAKWINCAGKLVRNVCFEPMDKSRTAIASAAVIAKA